MKSAISIFLFVICGLIARHSLAADVTFTIDPSADNKPISRYIYGINPSGALNRPAYADVNLTLARLGGNRWTAYNWLTNASNAGNDWHYSNDSYLDTSKEPGHAVRAVLADDIQRGAATIITVPMNGYLAADESGPVPNGVPPKDSPHFVPEYPTASVDSDPSKQHVYQDEFVEWVKKNYAESLAADSSHPIYFMLDNEPDLWTSTHSEVHPQKPTYAEMVQRSTAYASAIKKVVPDAIVFGPASYGWNGFISLQDAADAKPNNSIHGDFLSYYLAEMNIAGQKAGGRLLDALDVHWYPEAMGLNAAGTLTHISANDNAPGVKEARMNAPRSLWDPTYVEKSWITKDSTRGKPIALLPRLNHEIQTNYPGTKLSLSEYNYGGGDNISGGIAEADVLGLLGKYGVYAAAEWPMGSNEKFILGAMRMFRNFDGKGGAFGDTSISAVSSKPADSSIYASVDSRQMVLVAINRTMADMNAAIVLTADKISYNTFTVYQLTPKSGETKDGLNILPTTAGTFPINQLSHCILPAQSVSTLVLHSNP